ncbi:MAG: DUF11 domain-containing protein, partial [Anaerolineales bacterium]
GSITAYDLLISDLLPDGVDYSPDAADPPESQRVDRHLFWNGLGPIPPGGGTLVITIPVAVASQVPSGTMLANTMSVTYQNAAGALLGPRVATDTTRTREPVLRIAKRGEPDPVLAGHVMTYSLQITNSGPAAVTQVRITDVVPLSTTYQTCSPEPCAMSDGVVSWTLDALPAGHEVLSFSVWVSDTLESGALIRNQAYGITSDQTGYYSGPPVTTRVTRPIAFFEGHAFRDDDLDGQRDGGEMGLAGITVTLVGASPLLTTTDSSGGYHFQVETEGPMWVAAGMPAGYFRTTRGTVFTHAVGGITRTVNFGYAPLTSPRGAIYGIVFNDLDCDGVWDAQEPGIPGALLSLDQADTTTSDADGGYTFSATLDSIHSVVETDPDDYFSTTPNTVTLLVEGGHGYQVDFGDALTSSCFASIYGTVFHDTDMDGVWDYQDELGIPKVTIGMDGNPLTSTGPYGGYTMPPITEAATCTITETDLDGYVSTTPNLVTRSVELGHGYPVNFGDVIQGGIYLPIILKNG